MASTPTLLPCESPTEPTPKVSHAGPAQCHQPPQALCQLPQNTHTSSGACCPRCLKEVTATCAGAPALVLWSDTARDVLAPLWEDQRGTVLGAAAGAAAELTQPLSVHSSGLVLVTDAIAGMGLAPGRHTLGQQVVEIDGLNTYIAGEHRPANELGQRRHSYLSLGSPARLAVLLGCATRLGFGA